MADSKKPTRRGTLADLIEAGMLHPPLELERTYKGQRYTATVEPDGTVTVGGKTYPSLSLAAATVRAAALGLDVDYQGTNGWVFWCYRDDGGALVPIDALRKSPRD